MTRRSPSRLEREYRAFPRPPTRPRWAVEQPGRAQRQRPRDRSLAILTREAMKDYLGPGPARHRWRCQFEYRAASSSSKEPAGGTRRGASTVLSSAIEHPILPQHYARRWIGALPVKRRGAV